MVQGTFGHVRGGHHREQRDNDMPGKYVLDNAPYRLKVELVKAGIHVVQQFSIWAVWETTTK